MAIAPVNKFVNIAVPVVPGKQKLYEVPTGTSALLLYLQVANVGIGVTYPKVTFSQQRTQRSTGNSNDTRVIKDVEIPPNDAAVLVDGRLVLEKTPLVLDKIFIEGTQQQVGIITNVSYDEPSGIATVNTKDNHLFKAGDPICLSGIHFDCSGSTGITTNIFPNPQQSFIVDTVEGTVGASKTFSTVVGTSKGYPHVYNVAQHYYARSKPNAVEIVSSSGYTGYTKITPTTQNAGSPLTDYDPSTGILTIEKASHGFSNGDLIRIADGGIRFTCAKDSHGSNHDYPRATDPASGKLLEVFNAQTNTFDVQVGLANDGTAGDHTFVSAVSNCVSKVNERFQVYNAVYNGDDVAQTISPTRSYSVTNATYAPGTSGGNLVMTIGTHTLGVGDNIRIKPNSLAFKCEMDENTSIKTYPRSGKDPAYGTELAITARTATTITVDAGQTSLTTHNAVAGSGNETTTYDPNTGLMRVNIGSHSLKVGTSVKLGNDSFTFSCGFGGATGAAAQKTYPRSGDPARDTAVNIEAVTANTITLQVGPAGVNTGAHTYVSGGTVISGGAYDHTWAGGTSIKAVTSGGYTLASGELDLEIGTHSLQNSDKILIALDSIGFTCTMDNRATEHFYPRITDPAAKSELTLTRQGTTRIRVNVGKSLSGGYVAPLEMELIASILENSTS